MYGEPLTFKDPETRLPAIGRIKGFRPGGSSLYKRAIVAVCITEMVQTAWFYIGDYYLRPGLRLIPSGTWERATP